MDLVWRRTQKLVVDHRKCCEVEILLEKKQHMFLE